MRWLLPILLLAGCSRGSSSLRETTHVQGVVAGQPVDVVLTRQQSAQHEAQIDFGPIIQTAAQAGGGFLGASPLSLLGLAGLAGVAGLRNRKPKET